LQERIRANNGQRHFSVVISGATPGHGFPIAASEIEQEQGPTADELDKRMFCVIQMVM
jgi:hypothetical protein